MTKIINAVALHTVHYRHDGKNLVAAPDTKIALPEADFVDLKELGAVRAATKGDADDAGAPLEVEAAPAKAGKDALDHDGNGKKGGVKAPVADATENLLT